MGFWPKNEIETKKKVYLPFAPNIAQWLDGHQTFPPLLHRTLSSHNSPLRCNVVHLKPFWLKTHIKVFLAFFLTPRVLYRLKCAVLHQLCRYVDKVLAVCLTDLQNQQNIHPVLASITNGPAYSSFTIPKPATPKQVLAFSYPNLPRTPLQEVGNRVIQPPPPSRDVRTPTVTPPSYDRNFAFQASDQRVC